MAGSRPPLFVRLYQTGGAWGLPSTCAACIAAQALLRSTGLPLSLISGAAPGMTAAHTLPVAVFLRGDDPSAHGSPDLVPADGGDGAAAAGGPSPPTAVPGVAAGSPQPADTSVAVGVGGIVAALAARGMDVDAGLTPFMRAEAAAFAALTARDWAPARAAEFWVDDANYEDLLHTVLLPASPHPFPLNRLRAAARRRAATAAVAASLPPPLSAAVATAAGSAAAAPPRRALTARAAAAAAALAVRLGGGGGAGTFYRSATSPLTALDAVVYGELAAVLYAPLPANGLRAVVAAHPTLVAFCAAVRGAHFGDPTAADGGGGRPTTARRRALCTRPTLRNTRPRRGWCTSAPSGGWRTLTGAAAAVGGGGGGGGGGRQSPANVGALRGGAGARQGQPVVCRRDGGGVWGVPAVGG
ncbi:hypothetical protein BU14_0134s0016 [Porphyra umbilicalis]|uniref:Metaxin glutathione S-transferase domain-containing protein n=1 Tax=Porphyra umbilicalis TaxID=2786 RepID=A0A1X6PAN8_PORUM|nr:hypothetical protein BU14_0134s0016 [Porphyra umbilicalis]|eukprot:OSX77795.1 hypothetical protein BU14_0134s0016 [Porphyra umbilicalis]